MDAKRKIYIVYKGDEVITHGTQEECAEKIGVKPFTIYYLSTEAYKKRSTSENRMIAYLVGYEDKYGN